MKTKHQSNLPEEQEIIEVEAEEVLDEELTDEFLMYHGMVSTIVTGLYNLIK